MEFIKLNFILGLCMCGIDCILPSKEKAKKYLDLQYSKYRYST